MSNSIDDFMNHKTSEFSGGKFLKSWKKNGKKEENVQNPGVYIDTWMHMSCPPRPIWFHGFTKIEPKEDKDTREVIKWLWSDRFNCHETDDVLKSEYQHDDKGLRKKPPVSCGFCKLVDWVRLEVAASRINWLDPIFEFTGAEKNHRDEVVEGKIVYHAAGLYGGLRSDDDDEKAEMKKAGISPKTSWREKAMSGCNYIFRIVQHDLPGDGIVIATEAALLGEKVRSVLADRIQKYGRDDGNPLKKPVAIRWVYRENEKEFQKKYHAIDLPNLALPDNIRDLIKDAPPPSIDHMVEKGNQETLRAVMERYCVRKGIPWDDFFAKTPASTSSSGGSPSPAREESRPSESKKSEVKMVMTTAGVELPYDSCLKCDKCQKPMGEAWNKCPGCGETYPDGTEDPPTKPEAMRTRASKKAEAPKEEVKADPPASSDDEDEIPF